MIFFQKTLSALTFTPENKEHRQLSLHGYTGFAAVLYFHPFRSKQIELKIGEKLFSEIREVFNQATKFNKAAAVWWRRRGKADWHGPVAAVNW